MCVAPARAAGRPGRRRPASGTGTRRAVCAWCGNRGVSGWGTGGSPSALPEGVSEGQQLQQEEGHGEALPEGRGPHHPGCLQEAVGMTPATGAGGREGSNVPHRGCGRRPGLRGLRPLGSGWTVEKPYMPCSWPRPLVAARAAPSPEVASQQSQPGRQQPVEREDQADVEVGGVSKS